MKYKNIAIMVTAVLVASVANADTSQIEKDIVLLNKKRSVAVANLRLPIETAYLAELKKSYLKAEAAKDLDLQVKIKEEMKIVENNIAYFSAKKGEKVSAEFRPLFGVTWKSRQGYFVKFDDKSKKFSNPWHTNEALRVEGNKLYFDGDHYYEYIEELDVVKLGEDFYYRNGKIPREDPKVNIAEAPKAPEGEEINTLFGVRTRK